jgi:hypothetical protein
MRKIPFNSWLALWAGGLFLFPGCASLIATNRAVPCEAIPARRLGPELRGPQRDELVPVDFRLLRQEKPNEHVIAHGDTLGIYVRDVVDNSNDIALVHYPIGTESTHVEGPAVGHPFKVTEGGTLVLPDVPPIAVNGMTVGAATEAIREAYIKSGIVKQDNNAVSVNLVKPRTVEVIVLREDTGADIPVWKPRDGQAISRRGSAEVVALPAFENDVLHALTASGGLPGIDGFNEVWVLRGGGLASHVTIEGIRQQMEKEPISMEMVQTMAGQQPLVRIPLKVGACETLQFGPQDVILQEGDILFVPSRETEYFLTGGLLHGGMFALPRDYDIDIFGAIAIANGNALGPAGVNAPATNFNIKPGAVIPPSRAIVVRQIGSQQIKIDVDLKRALDDPKERLVIQPRDLILLKYRPSEFMGNLALNIVTFNFNIPNGDF